MIDKVIVDSSVVIKWFVTEVYTDEALQLLQAYEAGKINLAAPDLMLAEVGNILWKKQRFQGLSKRPEYAPKGSSDDGSREDYSLEKERQGPPKKRGKRRKNAEIKIDREEIVSVDPAELPADAEFKGYEEVIVQDIKVETDNECPFPQREMVQ